MIRSGSYVPVPDAGAELSVLEEDGVAKKIADSELRSLALPGARARLSALQAEVASLLATFPELRGAQRRQAAAARLASKRKKSGRKRPMSAAEKKAVSERMRKVLGRAESGEDGQEVVPKCRSAEVPKCRSAEVPSAEVPRVPKCQSAAVPECRSAECRGAECRGAKCRSAEVPSKARIA